MVKYFKDEKQFLPTFEQLCDKEAKELAKRLKGKSTKETLNNILEWQHRNIQYWTEKYYLIIIPIVILIPIILIPILIILRSCYTLAKFIVYLWNNLRSSFSLFSLSIC